MSERVRHAMLEVREASSFVPEIGTLRHEWQTTFDRVFTLSGTSKEQEWLAQLVSGALLLSRDERTKKKDLQKNTNPKR